MNNVMAELQAAGIDEKDIQTTRFNIYPVNKWDRDTEEEILVGYRVSNMVTIKIRDIESIGDIIDSVTDAGGDLTRIQNISFTVEDPTPYQEEARAKAVAQAKAKAEQLASLSEAELGKTTYITESQSYYYPVPMRAAEYDMVGGVQTPISPGEQEISVNVQIAFKIK